MTNASESAITLSNEELTEERLQNYYSRKPVPEGADLSKLARGWSVDAGSENRVYYRRLGGRGTPFVTCDLSIEWSNGAWLPFHGSVAMKPEATLVRAANALMDYWHSLPLRDRLDHKVYAALVARNSERPADQDHSVTGRRGAAAMALELPNSSSERSCVLASFSNEHGNVLYWQRSGAWSHDLDGAEQSLESVGRDFDRMLKTRSGDKTLAVLDADLLRRMTFTASRAKSECLEREGYDQMDRADPRRAALVNLAKTEAEAAVVKAGLHDVASEFAAMSRGQVPWLVSSSRFVIRHAATEPARLQESSKQAQDDAFEAADMLRAIDADSERLFSLLDHSGSMESQSIQVAVYRLRQSVALALGDQERARAVDEILQILEDGGHGDAGADEPSRERAR